MPTATRRPPTPRSRSTAPSLNRIILRELALPEAMAQGLVKIEGNPMKVAELFGLFDDFTMAFEIVEPLKAK